MTCMVNQMVCLHVHNCCMCLVCAAREGGGRYMYSESSTGTREWGRVSRLCTCTRTRHVAAIMEADTGVRVHVLVCALYK